jgi:wyosine [tRNA(Phe)-imidazoG37] synthetase (radical SAM superfamily)
MGTSGFSTNPTERRVQEYFHQLGYKSIRGGWPDFVFYKFNKLTKKNDYTFIEVKTPVKTGNSYYRKEVRHLISRQQKRIRRVFLDLDLNYNLILGFNDDGTPNIVTKHLRKAIRKAAGEKIPNYNE